MIRIAIDRGGTFTDIFAISDDGRVVSEKILSQSPHYDDPNAYGVELVLRRLGATMDEVEWIRLGTTVATNALLERKGADVSLLVTKGFRDLLEIGYQDRPDLFALEIKKPRPLYKEVLEVEERLDAQGRVVRPLGAIPRPRCKDVAVVSLHAYREPAHERAIKEALPDHRVTLSSDVMPLPKAIDRAASTVAEAYLAPVVRRYVERLSRHLPKEKLYFIKSDGGLAEADRFGGLDALLSGPAGGVVALRRVFAGEPLIGFDMGGTSTDVMTGSSSFATKTRWRASASPGRWWRSTPSPPGAAAALSIKTGCFSWAPRAPAATRGRCATAGEGSSPSQTQTSSPAD